jgi:phosphoribosylformylglycinamidine cyclo-ligase
VVQVSGMTLLDSAPFDHSQSLGRALLEPTRIYVGMCLKLARSGKVRAFAHITGGGLTDNLPRVLPDHLSCHIHLGSWKPAPVFDWMQSTGGIETAEMLRTFNCGIGMLIIVSEAESEAVMRACEEMGEPVFRIGEIVPRQSAEVMYHGGWHA